MRSFWKIILAGTLSLGGYLLYKKSNPSTETASQPEPTEEKKASPQAPRESSAEAKQDGADQIIERLTAIDGVTSRVAENLVEMGIKSKEALMKLSEEELMGIKGIGPKRAEKILNL